MRALLLSGVLVSFVALSPTALADANFPPLPPSVLNSLPAKKSIEEIVAKYVPFYWSVETLTLETPSKMESTDSTLIAQRFSIIVRPKENLYIEAYPQTLSGFISILPSMKPAATRTIYGELSYKYANGKFAILPPLFENNVIGWGRPLSMFSQPTVRADSEDKEKYEKAVSLDKMMRSEYSTLESKLRDEQTRKLELIKRTYDEQQAKIEDKYKLDLKALEDAFFHTKELIDLELQKQDKVKTLVEQRDKTAKADRIAAEQKKKLALEAGAREASYQIESKRGRLQSLRSAVGGDDPLAAVSGLEEALRDDDKGVQLAVIQSAEGSDKILVRERLAQFFLEKEQSLSGSIQYVVRQEGQDSEKNIPVHISTNRTFYRDGKLLFEGSWSSPSFTYYIHDALEVTGSLEGDRLDMSNKARFGFGHCELHLKLQGNVGFVFEGPVSCSNLNLPVFGPKDFEGELFTLDIRH